MSQLALRLFSMNKNMSLRTCLTNFKYQKVLYYAERRKKTLATKSDPSDISTEVRPLGERIKENTKTASYMGVILVGISVTGILFFAIFRELFSSTSANTVYSETLDRVKDDVRVQDALGPPIKGYGEESRRRRRQHVAHSIYERNGINYMRMQFYIQGIRNRATVHLEMKEIASGKLGYRYLFVQLDHPNITIIMEDNRINDAIKDDNNNTTLNSIM